MQKHINRGLFFFAIMIIGQSGWTSGKLLDHTLLAEVSRESMDSIRIAAKVPKSLLGVRYDVRVYEVIYETSWHDGTALKASGYYMVPVQKNKDLPLLAYNHGTRLRKKRVFKVRGEEAICTFFASDGYAVVMPDYIGLGKGEGQHLYHHSETEALANIDLLRAVKELNQILGKTESGQLFISGYSQGGHAALATHKYIEEHLQEEFEITASAPMSGAYDMDGVQTEVMWKPYSHPGYLPYLLLSFQEVYHLLPEGYSPFKAPYDTLLPRMMDGSHKLKEVNQLVPEIPVHVLKEEVLQDFVDDPKHPLRLAMAENSLVHWKPEAPVMLCFCKADEQVNYRNSLVAYKNMRELGAKNVHKRHAGSRFKQGVCAIYSSMYTKLWFDSFVNGSEKGRKGSLKNRFMIRLSRLFQKK